MKATHKLYRYVNANGSGVNRWYEIGMQPDEILIGPPASPDESLFVLQEVKRRRESGYPYFSDALGTGAQQIDEQMAADRRLGLNTEYNRDGQLKVNSRSERKKFCAAHGLFDRDAGYSDQARTTTPQEGLRRRSR